MVYDETAILSLILTIVTDTTTLIDNDHSSSNKLIVIRERDGSKDLDIRLTQLSAGSVVESPIGTFTATADAGHDFMFWTLDNVLSDTNPIIIPFGTGTHYLYARFRKSPNPLMHFGRVGRKFEYLLRDKVKR